MKFNVNLVLNKNFYTMKKLILSFAAIALTFWSGAQVICAGVSPNSIQGNYQFSWADPAGGWGTPDFLIPGTYIQDTLMMVDDGLPGTNAQGNPISAEGCNPLINNLTGKIAVIYRNTCEFGAKALNAQNAGAIGVIIINREPGVIAMGAGASGVNVTIPVVMIQDSDGLLITNEMLNGSVVMLLGNKTGLFANDGGLTKSTTLISKQGAVPSFLAQNGTEFNFDLGTRVYNYGNLAQAGMTLTATVTNPSGVVVYNNSVSNISLAAGDSLDVDPTQTNTLPQFSLASYPSGRYSLNYTLALAGADDYAADNSITTVFSIQDSLYSYAQLDATTNLPNAGNSYRPSTNNQTYSVCNVINDANASRIGAEGIYFSATTSTASQAILTGEEMALYLYKWEDVFVDLNDANLAFNTLTPVASGYYYYPADLQGEVVLGTFTTPVVLTDNQRYLACVQTVNLDLYLGHESNTDYTWNYNFYAQPLTPNESDAAYFAAGFGPDVPSSIAVRVFDANNIGLTESKTIDGVAYPNPATDKVTVSVNGEGVANLSVTDISGKKVGTHVLNLINGSADVSIENLEAGLYIFNVVLENGKTSQFNVVKK
jgi:hypothetical protein